MGDVVNLSAGLAASDQSAKRTGRRRLAIWLRSVDAKIESGDLIDFDGRVARALTRFPSSTLEGHCWVSQARLSRSLARSERTIRRSIARLERHRLLHVRLRGAGRTSQYLFCRGGEPVFPNLSRLIHATERDSDRTKMSGLDRTRMSSQSHFDRTPVSAESTKKLTTDSTNHHESSADAAAKSGASGAAKRSSDGRLLPIHVIIDRLVLKLGHGDQDRGWSIYRDIPDQSRIELRQLERDGRLTDEVIGGFLADARGAR
jgi:Helix-turn-helix domain